MKPRFIFSILSGLALVFAMGCSDDDPAPVLGADPTNLGSGAQVRVVHASPDAPAVDVYAEGVSTPLLRNLAYGSVSAYLDLAPGSYNIQLRAAGSPAGSAPAYETGALTIPKDAKITAVAMGLLLNSTGSSDAFRVVPYAEGFDAASSGNAIVRIIHASADAPTVAIDVNDDASPEIPSLARFAETGATGVELPANQPLQIAIWTASPLERVTAFTTPALPEGAEIFVIATGLLAKQPREEDGFGLLAAGPAGGLGIVRQNPVVYAFHGSPDAPAVDIYAGAAELVENLSFGELSGALQVPPGSYTLDFRKNSDGMTAATLTTPALIAGERYLAIATGFVGDMSFKLLPVVDSFDTTPGATQVRVVHASPDAPAVDVGTVSGSTLSPIGDFTNLAFEQSSDPTGTTVPAASLEIGVAATGSTSPAATFDVTTTPGLRAFAVAAGSFLGDGESFRLFVVDTGAWPWTNAEVMPNP